MAKRAGSCLVITMASPTPAQRRYLQHGLDQAGGKLPIFDRQGQRVAEQTVRACIRAGWATPWFRNPLKPDWTVCKLTDAGKAVLNSVRHRELA
jgi:hypothetical protein